MIKINKTTTHSTYLLEEYFPIKIHFGNYNVESHKTYIRIDYDDFNALEMLFNKNTPKDIAEINLIVSNNFEVINDTLIIPQSIDICSISSTNSDKIKVDSFKVTIFNNCIELKFNNKQNTKSILCGDVIFNFSENMEINSLILTNVSDELRDHIIKELEYDN